MGESGSRQAHNRARQALLMNRGDTARRSEFVLEWIGRGKRVLDLGCNDGKFSVEIKKNGNDVVGVEVTPESAQAARRAGIDVREFDLENETWDLYDNEFDVVFAGEIIEHLVETDSFLVNIHRIVRPGGQLILTTPNLASLGRRLLLLVGRNPFVEVSPTEPVSRLQPVGHLRYFVKRSLVSLLERHGFLVNDITSDGLIIGPWNSALLGRMMPSLAWRFILLATAAEAPRNRSSTVE